MPVHQRPDPFLGMPVNVKFREIEIVDRKGSMALSEELVIVGYGRW